MQVLIAARFAEISLSSILTMKQTLLRFVLKQEMENAVLNLNI
jgi:hypothetical protein